MIGRVYDPELGRMLSPDPIVQAPFNLQSYNRYSYVMNNPGSYTDPSGYYGVPADRYDEHGHYEVVVTPSSAGKVTIATKSGVVVSTQKSNLPGSSRANLPSVRNASASVARNPVSRSSTAVPSPRSNTQTNQGSEPTQTSRFVDQGIGEAVSVAPMVPTPIGPSGAEYDRGAGRTLKGAAGALIAGYVLDKAAENLEPGKARGVARAGSGLMQVSGGAAMAKAGVTIFMLGMAAGGPPGGAAAVFGITVTGLGTSQIIDGINRTTDGIHEVKTAP